MLTVLLIVSPAQAAIFGDLDCDDEINVVDVLLSINMALGIDLSEEVDSNQNNISDACEPIITEVLCGVNTVLNEAGDGCEVAPGLLADVFAEGVASVEPASFCGEGTFIKDGQCNIPSETALQILCDYGDFGACCDLGAEWACQVACGLPFNPAGDTGACCAIGDLGSCCELGDQAACEQACDQGIQSACCELGVGVLPDGAQVGSCSAACFETNPLLPSFYPKACGTACANGDGIACGECPWGCAADCQDGDQWSCEFMCGMGDEYGCASVACSNGDLQACSDVASLVACSNGDIEACPAACSLWNDSWACASESCLNGDLSSCVYVCEEGLEAACDILCLDTGCPSMGSLGDNLCDPLCFNAFCFYDGGDCD